MNTLLNWFGIDTFQGKVVMSSADLFAINNIRFLHFGHASIVQSFYKI